MATFESLEGLLAQALQRIDDSAGLVRELPLLEEKPNLRRLGQAIVGLWEIREQIHKLRPDLKPPFVIERQQDSVRYEKLQELSFKAYSEESTGNLSEAYASYSQLKSAAVSGYFCVVAEAGLYRISNSRSEP